MARRPNIRGRKSVVLVACVTAMSALAPLHLIAAAPDEMPAALTVFPEKITFVGADRMRQLVVTGRYAQVERDVTALVRFRSSVPGIVKVSDTGVVLPVKNGETELTLELAGKSLRIPVTVRGMEQEQPINFTNEIVPVFSKLGCNSGACHGKSGGQNGFALSLLGFVPEMDYQSIVKESHSRRIFPAAPPESLLLKKATGRIGHGGGKRLAVDTAEYKLLVRWIKSGMPWGKATDPHVVRISVTPEHRILTQKSRQQLAVVAHLSDGSEEDVTARAEFTNYSERLLTINDSGLITTLTKSGDGAVMVRYLGQVAVFRTAIPSGADLDGFPRHLPSNFVDQHVFAKLKQLGIPPSDLCNDHEFLRRVSIDITGTLPTPAEVEKFLADPSSRKREKLIDELLERPAYANYFALKWGDVLRNRLGENYNDPFTAHRTTNFHAWIRDSIKQNKPYDRFVREILTARGDIVGKDSQPTVAWYTFLTKPEQLVDDTAQIFLGTQVQCARCHHHPFENWSQEDYWGLAAFYSRLKWAKANGASGNIASGFPWSIRIDVTERGSVQSALPLRKSFSQPRTLDGTVIDVPPGQDPREKLADWLVKEPLFARAVVNRYWGHFLGRGIVDPVDDLRVTNPPSNPELLEALAQDFVQHQFDLKHLVRVICGSKTYQLSGAANALNKDDMQNYSHHLPRRLSAEVMVDALDQVNATTTTFNLGLIRKNIVGEAEYQKYDALRSKLRAIELPDEKLFTTPLFKVFEKPNRETASESERGVNPSLSQTLFLLNAKEIQEKISGDRSRAALLAADARPLPDRINEIYLWCYGRPPTERELRVVENYLERRTDSAANRRGFKDVFWALINTKEFQFNH
jgi:hypothetical protein